MEYTNVQLLFIINFLHLVSTALVLPITPHYFQSKSATHFIIGSLTALVYASVKIRRDLTALLPSGKKYAITVSLYFSFVYFFTLVFYDDVVSVFIVKCLWALTIDITQLCKEFVIRTEPEEKLFQIVNLLDLSKCGAMALGAVVGSYIYASSEDTSTNLILSSCLSLICILLFQRVDSDDSALEKPRSYFYSIPEMCRERLQKLKNTYIVDNWNHFVCIAMYIFIYCIYWTRIFYILMDKYKINCIHLGYIVAVENIIKSACNLVIPFITERYEDRRPMVLHSMFVTGILLAGFYAAPTFQCALTLFTILIFFYTMVNDLLDDDVLNLRYDSDVKEASETVKVLINIVAPILSGIVYDLFGSTAIDVIAALSLSVFFYMVVKSLLHIDSEHVVDVNQVPLSDYASRSMS